MADSNLTKKALAASLKENMEELSFDKITVAHICNKCNMNRKSFYYHFKDKYDLVNWIYYTEFASKIDETAYKDGFKFLYDVCSYLEQNKRFYRKVLKYDGQNSFFEYFKELLVPVIEKSTCEIFADNENNEFFMSFFSDAFVNAIKKWLLDPEAVSAEKFILLMKECIYGAAKKVANDISNHEPDKK